MEAAGPDSSAAFKGTFAPAQMAKTVSSKANTRDITYVKALNEALEEEMNRDKSLIILGEDVELLGGLYGVTRGLVRQFKERVRDTPISENTFTGAGIGAAVRGCRAVVELMYMDFFALAMDQIVNLAAKLHYMTGGQLRVPVVIRTAIGAG